VPRVLAIPDTMLILLLIGSLGAAADNLDLVGRDGVVAAVHLESDVLDQKSPDFVTEAVRVQRALERKASLNPLIKGLGNDAVKLGQDLHGELGIDALGPDKIVQCIRQRRAQAATVQKSFPLAISMHSVASKGLRLSTAV